MGGARGTYATKINAYTILVGRSDGKRPLRIPKRKPEDNTEMDVACTGWESLDGIYLAQNWDTFGALV
jgi:hypothetical protein